MGFYRVWKHPQGWMFDIFYKNQNWKPNFSAEMMGEITMILSAEMTRKTTIILNMEMMGAILMMLLSTKMPGKGPMAILSAETMETIQWQKIQE